MPKKHKRGGGGGSGGGGGGASRSLTAAALPAAAAALPSWITGPSREALSALYDPATRALAREYYEAATGMAAPEPPAEPMVLPELDGLRQFYEAVTGTTLEAPPAAPAPATPVAAAALALAVPAPAPTTPPATPIPSPTKPPASPRASATPAASACDRLCSCAVVVAALVAILVLAAPLISDLVDPEERLLSDLVNSRYLADLRAANATVELPLSPGERLAARGLSKRHPVVFIPGIISSPLELYKARPCLRKHLRSRIWGDAVMARAVLLSPACWLEHIVLNETTGLDPDGIKLRASTGLRALESLAGAYTLWGGIATNLVHLGYDESSMHMASYDWRLGFWDAEERDQAFTQLKVAIERMYEGNDRQRVVAIAHSMGALVWSYFQQWVHALPPHGPRFGFLDASPTCDLATCIRPPTCPIDGSPASPDAHADAVTRLYTAARWDMCGGCACRFASWTDKHVEAFVDVAGPMLGVPKALASVLSGDQRNFAELPAVVSLLKEALLSRRQLRDTFRSFPSMMAMLPAGGHRFWGGARTEPDQPTSPSLLCPLAATVRGDAQAPYAPCQRVSAAPDQEVGQPDLAHIITLRSPNLPAFATAAAAATDPSRDDAAGRFRDPDDDGAAQRLHLVAWRLASRLANSTAAGVSGHVSRFAKEAREAVAGMQSRQQSWWRQVWGGDGNHTTLPPSNGSSMTLSTLGDAATTAPTTPHADPQADEAGWNQALQSRTATAPPAEPATPAAPTVHGVAPSHLGDALGIIDVVTQEPVQAADAPSPVMHADDEELVDAIVAAVAAERAIREAMPPEGAFSRLARAVAAQVAPDAAKADAQMRAALLSLRRERLALTLDDTLAVLHQVAPQYAARLDAALNISAWRPEQAMSEAESRFLGLPPRAGLLPPRYWANALTAVLPVAPTSKIICLYGVGRVTERSYIYEATPPDEPGVLLRGRTHPQPAHVAASHPSSRDALVSAGVVLGDGDGTVPLMSLGYMCERGWRDPARNPGGNIVRTREYRDIEAELLPQTPGGRAAAASGGGGGSSRGRRPGSDAASEAFASAAAAAHEAAVESAVAAGAAAVEAAGVVAGAAAAGGGEAGIAAAQAAQAAAAGAATGAVAAAAAVDKLAIFLWELSTSLTHDGIVQGGMNLLRGAGSSDHVDVLLNAELVRDLLLIAVGAGDEVTPRVHSRIPTYAARVRDGL